MILPIVFVYAATRAFWFSISQPWYWRGPEWMDGVIKIGLWVIPTLLLLVILRRGAWQAAVADLGLARPAWRGVAFAVAATLPMAAFLAVSPLLVDPASLAAAVLLGPFAEEVLYRGFLFHQLQRRAGWSMPWAALGSAVVFALAHHNNLDEVLVTAVLRESLAANIARIGPPTLATIAGGCLFAWMTWRWQSLWPAIALHAAVNFWWDVAPLAVLSPAASLTHGLALVIAAAVTWRLTPGRGHAAGAGLAIENAPG
jgi:membrane protease YdiL (CAAX protease family)